MSVTKFAFLPSNSAGATIHIFSFVAVQSLSHVQLFVTPWTVAHQAPLSMEFSRQEYWSGLPFSPPGDLPNPGIFSTQGPNPCLLHFYRWILYHCTTQVFFTFCIFLLAIVDLHITESGGLESEQNWSPRLMNNILGLLWNTFNDFWLAIHRPFWGFVYVFFVCLFFAFSLLFKFLKMHSFNTRLNIWWIYLMAKV